VSAAYHFVLDFHRAFGLAIKEKPTPDVCKLRSKLINEEAFETELELLPCDRPPDLGKVAKELADLVYVAYGTAISFGINLDEAIYRVHVSNMSKLGADGKPIHREDGKVLKGPNYREPDMSSSIPDWV
jgi:predicted HAD superfamily Cof-like phosphohydrolase